MSSTIWGRVPVTGVDFIPCQNVLGLVGLGSVPSLHGNRGKMVEGQVGQTSWMWDYFTKA